MLGVAAPAIAVNVGCSRVLGLDDAVLDDAATEDTFIAPIEDARPETTDSADAEASPEADVVDAMDADADAPGDAVAPIDAASDGG